MIAVSRIIDGVRWKENDVDAARLSDYDIIEALNEALRYMSLSLADKRSEYLLTVQVCEAGEPLADGTAVYDIASEGWPLPPDLVALEGVYRLSDSCKLHAVGDISHIHDSGFVVMGGRLYTRHDFRLTYFRELPEAEDGEAEIDLPSIFLEPLIKMVRVVLDGGDHDTMTQAFDAAIDAAIPRRRYSNARQRLPWYM